MALGVGEAKRGKAWEETDMYGRSVKRTFPKAIGFFLSLSALLGFCPVSHTTLKTRKSSMVVGLASLTVQLAMLTFLCGSVFMKSEAVFSFNDRTIIGILHLSSKFFLYIFGVQGFLCCVSNLWGLGAWRAFVESFSATSEEMPECETMVWAHCKRGLWATVVGAVVYGAAVVAGVRTSATSRGGEKVLLGLLQMLAAVALGFYAFLMMLIGSQMNFHFHRHAADLTQALQKADQHRKLSS